jgi:hypothetical protein
MENTQQTNANNAVQILAKAAEGYLNTLDELARTFVTPQVQASIQIFSSLVAEKYPAPAAPVAEAAPPANDA